jgi:hypothetical protein
MCVSAAAAAIMLSPLLLLGRSVVDVHGAEVEEGLCGVQVPVGSGDVEGCRADAVVGR